MLRSPSSSDRHERHAVPVEGDRIADAPDVELPRFRSSEELRATDERSADGSAASVGHAQREVADDDAPTRGLRIGSPTTEPLVRAAPPVVGNDAGRRERGADGDPVPVSAARPEADDDDTASAVTALVGEAPRSTAGPLASLHGPTSAKPSRLPPLALPPLRLAATSSDERGLTQAVAPDPGADAAAARAFDERDRHDGASATDDERALHAHAQQESEDDEASPPATDWADAIVSSDDSPTRYAPFVLASDGVGVRPDAPPGARSLASSVAAQRAVFFVMSTLLVAALLFFALRPTPPTEPDSASEPTSEPSPLTPAVAEGAPGERVPPAANTLAAPAGTVSSTTMTTAAGSGTATTTSPVPTATATAPPAATTAGSAPVVPRAEPHRRPMVWRPGTRASAIPGGREE